MDKVGEILLRAKADPEFGIVARSRVIREQSRLLRELARGARACARMHCARARRARADGPAPRWLAPALKEPERVGKVRLPPDGKVAVDGHRPA